MLNFFLNHYWSVKDVICDVLNNAVMIFFVYFWKYFRTHDFIQIFSFIVSYNISDVSLSLCVQFCHKCHWSHPNIFILTIINYCVCCFILTYSEGSLTCVALTNYLRFTKERKVIQLYGYEKKCQKTQKCCNAQKYLNFVFQLWTV